MIDGSLVRCVDEGLLIEGSEAAPPARRDHERADAGRHNLANGRIRHVLRLKRRHSPFVADARALCIAANSVSTRRPF
jgi:hypothetical protein